MSQHQPSAASRIATGAAVGLIAGLIASFAMDRFQALIRSSKSHGESATEKAADKVSMVVTGSPIADDGKARAGQIVHYALGAAFGVGYGVAAEFAPQVTVGLGTAFAIGTWALLDEAAVPAAGLGDPPSKSPLSTQAFGLVSHLVFGVAAELTRLAGMAQLSRLKVISR